MLTDKLKKLILESGLNVREVSRRTKIPQSTLQKIVTNQSKKPHPQTLKKLSDFFGISTSEITDEPTSQKNSTLPSLKGARVETGNIFIGVHGASGRTEVKIEHEDGSILGIAEGEPVSIHESIESSWNTILRTINSALAPSGLALSSTNHKFHIGLGLKYTEFIQSTHDFEKSSPKYFSSIKVASDGFITCYGAHKKDGGIIIIDEGVVANALWENETIKVGGWGFPHADRGSYPWVAIETLRYTFEWIDGNIAPSELLKAIFNKFNNNSVDIVKWAMQARLYQREYRMIYAITADFFKRGDIYSVEIFKKVAKVINQTYIQLCTKTLSNELPCCIYGLHDVQIEHYYNDKLIKNLTYPQGSELDGAIRMIKETLDNTNV